MTAICSQHSNDRGSMLYLAFELGWTHWRLACSTGVGARPRHRTIAARDLEALRLEIERARKRFGLPADAPVVSCYEAGRDGFWLHRFLEAAGIRNLVVDSSSIEVNRRARRAKSDGLDAGKLLSMLIRFVNGERKVWSVVHVPQVQAEDERHLHRELMTLRKDRTRHTNRIKGWLAGCGLDVAVDGDLPETLSGRRLWDGSAVSPRLQQRVQREYVRRHLVDEQIRQLENERARLIRRADTDNTRMVRDLMRLRGIGPNSAWLYVMEFFGWRRIRNRRQLGSLAGLTPTPFQSGHDDHEQGISKAGNRRIRAMAIEIAWGWLRFQPDSELSQWYERRFGGGSPRLKKIGIVALARKLLVKLWLFLETGEVPQGAVLTG
jgi:transposase